MFHNIYKAEKGLIRIRCEVQDGNISMMRITGDFFLIPEESVTRLESLLNGKPFSESGVKEAIDSFYKIDVQTPAVNGNDFATAILGAKDENAVA